MYELFLEMRDSGMEKDNDIRDFENSVLESRLIIALFLISIVPLTGISFYSFHIFQKRFGKTFHFHLTDFIHDQSEYGK